MDRMVRLGRKRKRIQKKDLWDKIMSVKEVTVVTSCPRGDVEPMEVDPPKEDGVEPMEVDPPKEDGVEPMEVDPPEDTEEPMEVDPPPEKQPRQSKALHVMPSREWWRQRSWRAMGSQAPQPGPSGGQAAQPPPHRSQAKKVTFSPWERRR